MGERRQDRMITDKSYAPYSSRLDHPILDDMYVESTDYDYRGEPGYQASQSGRNWQSVEHRMSVLKRLVRLFSRK